MNHFPRITLAVLAVASSILFSSCMKEYEYVKQHPGAEVTGCRVSMMISTWEGNPQRIDTFRVHYNAFGDPTEMVASPVAAMYWLGDKHFWYDKQHRLTDYIWGNPSYSDYRLIWHRYTYIGKSLVSDSQFNYIEHGGGPNPPPETFAYLTIDSLDTEGRIVKTTEPGSPPSIGYFNYNAKGNLQGGMYDNKLNIYHTSRVWMFITKDYSVNNRLDQVPFSPLIQIPDYNAAGLPLLFQLAPNVPANGYIAILFNAIAYHKLKVVYDCDPGKAGL